jgi:hypothetical protein
VDVDRSRACDNGRWLDFVVRIAAGPHLSTGARRGGSRRRRLCTGADFRWRSPDCRRTGADGSGVAAPPTASGSRRRTDYQGDSSVRSGRTRQKLLEHFPPRCRVSRNNRRWYAADPSFEVTVPSPDRAATQPGGHLWPAPGELAVLRRRAAAAVALIDAGRYAPGVRDVAAGDECVGAPRRLV